MPLLWHIFDFDGPFFILYQPFFWIFIGYLCCAECGRGPLLCGMLSGNPCCAGCGRGTRAVQDGVGEPVLCGDPVLCGLWLGNPCCARCGWGTRAASFSIFEIGGVSESLAPRYFVDTVLHRCTRCTTFGKMFSRRITTYFFGNLEVQICEFRDFQLF